VQGSVIRNILLIQNDVEGAQVVRDALTNAERFHVEWVRSCALGLERLIARGKQTPPRRDEIAVILVDLSLPDIAGMEAVDRIYAASKEVPIVILASSNDEATATAAMQRGARDFLLKERLDDYVLQKTLAAVIDRAAFAEALFIEQERAQITLNSIGDAVISTDVDGRVRYLNIVAERLTGWPSAEAIGQPLEEVFRIIDSDSGAVVPNPLAAAAHEDRTVALPPTCILIRRDGVESAIEESSAPIHDRHGQVTGAVMVFHDVSTARAMTLQLAYLAQHDSLTDLPNRALLNDRMNRAVSMAQRHHTALAVLHIDLDRFKHINDSMGRLVGDRLLRSIAERLTACARASDTVSRLGGDEFVVLLPEVAHANAAAVCGEKLLQAVKLHHVLDGHELHITASIGIVLYPEDGTDVETLLHNADSAMYEAKDLGRDNYQFYRTQLNSNAVERQSMESGLRHALERHELELRYQPIINLATGAIVAAEALIRWQHPEQGTVQPSRFIAIAEECGLIVPIGQWILREACQQAKRWQDLGLPPLRLAVNTSAVELRSKEFVAGVARILAETGFDPSRLELELTETFLMQDSAATAIVLDALKNHGVTLALDDFGTGYSSLSYMRRFPIDALKIDQSFVRDLATDADDASVVSAIIRMGKSLHMRVVAEGVETRKQKSFLAGRRCTEAQGYYFSPPLQAGEFTDLLVASSLRVSKLRSSVKPADG
jgi:diguanylate cyclase (GGDEF)-like protein/PAS domain S-box-containing protein